MGVWQVCGEYNGESRQHLQSNTHTHTPHERPPPTHSPHITPCPTPLTHTLKHRHARTHATGRKNREDPCPHSCDQSVSRHVVIRADRALRFCGQLEYACLAQAFCFGNSDLFFDVSKYCSEYPDTLWWFRYLDTGDTNTCLAHSILDYS